MKMHIVVDIKPFSANAMWMKRGRGVAPTPKYKQWTEDCMCTLKQYDKQWIFEEKTLLKFDFKYGISNANSDLDNLLKPTLDVFQKSFEKFNDRYVFEIKAEKFKVAKGNEYIAAIVERYIDEEENK